MTTSGCQDHIADNHKGLALFRWRRCCCGEVSMKAGSVVLLTVLSMGCALFPSGGFVFGLASRTTSAAATVGELRVAIHEWAVPTKGAHPHVPAVGPDGALWFTEQMVNKMEDWIRPAVLSR